MKFTTDGSALLFHHQGEMVRIEPWGQDSLRVRATMQPALSGQDWALTEAPERTEPVVIIGGQASITNGRIKAEVNHAGVISFYRDDALILREYFRAYDGTISRESRCLKIFNREWKGVTGGSEYSLNVKFESNEGEKIFGMGQYQQPCRFRHAQGDSFQLHGRDRTCRNVPGGFDGVMAVQAPLQDPGGSFVRGPAV